MRPIQSARPRWTRRLERVTAILLFTAFTAHAQTGKPVFTDQQLDQMLAPIALYPDALFSQVLMASTYPADVAEAAKWAKANLGRKGDDAVKAVADKPWDPSVQSLVAFPDVIAIMGEKPAWVQTLGDAFLAQPDRLMDRAQFLRKKAQEAGNLKTTEQQTVTVEAASPTSTSTNTTIIVIEPAQPEVIYVPVYNPTIVYGTWWWPAPPMYIPPPPGWGFGHAIISGIGFGIGIGIANSLWGGCNWHNHNVNINVNRYNNINVNRQLNVNQNNTNWKHNSANRGGTPYRDSATREKFGQNQAGVQNRQDFRGRDASRDQARQAMESRGVAPAANNQQALDRARQAQQGMQNNRPAAAQNNAFSGVNNPAQSHQAINRGQASRPAMSRPAGGGGGRR